MSEEEKRYIVEDDGFSILIEDTTLTEDKHEGKLYTAYDSCRKLNEQDAEIKKLKKENQELKELNIPIDEIKDTISDARGRTVGVYYND